MSVIRKKDILVVQVDWNAEVEQDAQADWETFVDPTAMSKQMREVSDSRVCNFNGLVLTNTRHSPDGKHHDQFDYILLRKRFQSGVNIHRIRSFPEADIGSDHDLVMMAFRVRLKKARKPVQPRLRLDLEKMRDQDVACTFQATIGWKFAPLIGLRDEDRDTSMT